MAVEKNQQAADSEAFELTEEEINNALNRARREKEQALRRKKYWEEVNKPITPFTVTPEGLWKMAKDQFMQITGKEFMLDEYNRSLIKMLIQYFTSNHEFENNGNGYSLHKGLFLYGGVGCGKTTIMNMFSVNQVQTYITVSCRKVTSDFSQYGDDGIHKYWNPNFSTSLMFNPFKHQTLGICFDDLGTEDTSRHYGNQKNVLADVILNRYDRVHALKCKTHMTTNLTAAQIGEFYGPRFTSRCKEMFNIIELPEQPDRRK